jgi:hypothetical protein
LLFVNIQKIQKNLLSSQNEPPQGKREWGRCAILSVGLNFVELGKKAQSANSVRGGGGWGMEIYNSVWFNKKFLFPAPAVKA